MMHLFLAHYLDSTALFGGKGLLQSVAVCCGVLQSVAVCYSLLQSVAVCCSLLQSVAVCCSVLQVVLERSVSIALQFCCGADISEAYILLTGQV